VPDTDGAISPNITVAIDSGHNAIEIPSQWWKGVVQDFPIQWKLSNRIGG
jgi:hypothetical protein